MLPDRAHGRGLIQSYVSHVTGEGVGQSVPVGTSQSQPNSQLNWAVHNNAGSGVEVTAKRPLANAFGCSV